MKYTQYFVEKFARTTFVGFIIAVIAIYLKPEIQNTILLMYGVLGGKNAMEVYKNKGNQTDGKANGS
jgi:hypothetical protein